MSFKCLTSFLSVRTRNVLKIPSKDSGGFRVHESRIHESRVYPTNPQDQESRSHQYVRSKKVGHCLYISS